MVRIPLGFWTRADDAVTTTAEGTAVLHVVITRRTVALTPTTYNQSAISVCPSVLTRTADTK